MTRLLQRWQRFSKRQQLIVFALSSGCLLWAIDAVVLRPLRHRVGRLRSEVRETEQRLLEAVAASHQAEAITLAFAAYEPYVKASGSAESELAGVLSDVEAAVRESGMVLLNLRPSAQRGAASSVVSVTVDGESSPGQLAKLLDLIQRSARLLRVTELTIRVSEGKTLRSSLVVSKLLL